MAKYALRIRARELRKKGVSVKRIANQLCVSKGSVSLWVRDIILTVEQLEKLRRAEIKGAELGRLKGAFNQKQKKLELIKKSRRLGIEKIGKLSDREFLTSGLALYWAEGNKKQRRVELCNSDPMMIQFTLLWLQKFFNIKQAEIVCCVGINEAHRLRDDVVRKYWSNNIGIPLSQFRKTSFKKVQSKKVYENFNEHFGTLSIRVSNPSRIYYQIIGLIEGLMVSISQGSSAG